MTSEEKLKEFKNTKAYGERFEMATQIFLLPLSREIESERKCSESSIESISTNEQGEASSVGLNTSEANECQEE